MAKERSGAHDFVGSGPLVSFFEGMVLDPLLSVLECMSTFGVDEGDVGRGHADPESERQWPAAERHRADASKLSEH